MDHLYRLIRLLAFFVVGLLIGGTTVVAYASSSYPPSNAWSYPWTVNTGNFASVAEVCAFDIAQPGWAASSPGYTFTCANINQPSNPVPGATQGTYQVKAQKDANVFYTGRVTHYYSRCPDGGTLQGGVCVIPDNCPAAGTPQSSGWFLMGPSPTSPFPGITCSGSCLVTFDGSAPAGTTVVNGVKQYYARGTWQYLGPSNTCTGADTTPTAQASMPDNSCGAGKQGGYVNGKWTCVDPNTGNVVPSSTPIPQPPKTETTEKSTTTNPDGSTTTTETTNHPDGSTTTTTTTTQPNGDKESTTTHTPADRDEQDAFCEENPDSPICKDSSFGGGCGSFTCEGDAVQCAMAKEQHERNCEMFETETPLSILGNQVASGSDPQASTMPWASGQVQTQDLSGAISQEKWLGSSAGLSDKQFTLMGQSFTLPFSKANPILEIMGAIVVAFSLIAAARIVGVH